MIALTAFGDDYRRMAEQCIVSLRFHGCRDRIVALSDGGVDGAEVVNFPASDRRAMMAARLSIPDVVDLSSAGRLWYLDCDITAVGPWERMDAQLLHDDIAVIAEACTTVIGDQFVSACLSVAERLKHYRAPAVNSGVIGVNLRHPSWRMMWDDLRELSLQRMTERVLDESAPNAIALRYGLRHIDRSLVHYPANPVSNPAGAVLIHYAGMSVEQRPAR